MRISDWSSDLCSSDLWIEDRALARADPHAKWHRPLPGRASALCRRFALRPIVGLRHRRARGAGPARRSLAGGTGDLHVARLPDTRQPGRGGGWAGVRRHGSQWWHHHLLRSEEHTSELQSIMRISYAVLCLKKKKTNTTQ